MNIQKCINRDRKRNKRRNGMRRDGDSAKNIQRILQKRRDEQLRKLREEKIDQEDA